jgi:hypothetical protein
MIGALAQDSATCNTLAPLRRRQAAERQAAVSIGYWIVLLLIIVPASWLVAGLILWVLFGGHSDPPHLF